LVVEDHLGDARADDADAELARVIAFDDADVRIADLALDLLAQRCKFLAPLFRESREWHAADARARPEKHLRGAVLADHLCVDGRRVDAVARGEMHLEALRIEEGAGREHALVAGRLARYVGE